MSSVPEQAFMNLAEKSEAANPGGGSIDKEDLRDCFRRLRDNDDIRRIAANVSNSNINTIAKAYEVISDIWGVIKSLALNTQLALTYLMISVAEVVTSLCSAIGQAVVSVVTSVWEWLTSYIPSVISWAFECTWSTIKYLLPV